MNPREGFHGALAEALARHEHDVFVQPNPQSRLLAERAAQHLLFGVPLHWMTDWGTPFALQVANAEGARLTDADGHHLSDFCLGDTAAMFGHSPDAVAQALARQATRGLSAMLPGADAAAVGELLTERFALPFWQFVTTATDANRFVLRWLRAASGRRRIIVFNGCYHGTVDDVFVDLVNGEPVQRASLLGQVHELTAHTAVVEFNDLDALARELAMGDVACVLTEPAMTNIGMVLPEPGYWPAAQALMRRHGTALQRLLDGADVDMANFRAQGSRNSFVANMFLWGPGFFTSSAFMMAAIVERLMTAIFEPPGGAEASRLAR